MAKNSRTLARQCAVQALYQWQLTGQSPEMVRQRFIYHSGLSGKPKQYFINLIEQIPQYLTQIDAVIAPYLQRDEALVDLVDRSILRVATFELKYDPSVPTNVILNEAISLAKLFGSEHAYKFVNGVLDRVAADTRGKSNATQSQL